MIPFHSPSTPVQTRRPNFDGMDQTTACMQRTNEEMLRIIDQSRKAIAETRKRIAGVNALLASAAVADYGRPVTTR